MENKKLIWQNIVQVRYLGLRTNYDVLVKYKSQITITYMGTTKTKFAGSWGRTVNFSYCHRQSDCIVSLRHFYYHRLLLCVSACYDHTSWSTPWPSCIGHYTIVNGTRLSFFIGISLYAGNCSGFFSTHWRHWLTWKTITSLKISVFFTHLHVRLFSNRTGTNL